MADFPGLNNVDVYRYDNNLDYDRWAPSTRIKMCNVPWCGDYDNVVRFTDEDVRDAYLDALTGEVQTFDTMFHIKPDGTAKVPVPITSAQGYNYLVVDLPRPTSDEQPLMYADGPRKARYLYFIADARQLSPNTTLLTLSLDVWQTYIYDMTFDYVMLERGHAPVAANTVDAYLANPRGNSEYLLTADVGGDKTPYIAKRTETKNYSAETQRACIATYADLQGDYGTVAAPLVPALNAPTTSGVLAPRVYTVAIDALEGFLRSMEFNAPWLKPSIRGIFFAPGNLLTESSAFKLWSTEVKIATATQHLERFIKPERPDFGYPAKFANFAKLYTWPYAAIRLNDENGAEFMVRVEDLNASGIEIASALNLIAPFVRLDARLLGIAGATDALTFTTCEGLTYSYGGAWGEYLKSWYVPVMEIAQPASSAAAYNSVYQRAHAKLAADNALTSALASHATGESNVKRSSAASVANTKDRINCANDVNDSNATLASNVTTRMNSSISSNVAIDNAMSASMTDVKNDIAALAGIANAGSTLAHSGISATASGPAALAGGAVGTVSSAVSTLISQSSNEAFTTLATNANTLKGAEQKLVNSYTNSQQLATNKSNLTRTNACETEITQRNADTANANAAATRATNDENANRTHATAIDAIAANLAQASVNPPVTFGSSSNLANLATAPRALFAQIVTQRDCDIANAASNFARYGYALMREWSMTDMQVMKYFTYWKCAEVWCSGVGNALEGAQAIIKNILIAGTTVWDNPAKIGRVSVYDNFVD